MPKEVAATMKYSQPIWGLLKLLVPLTLVAAFCLPPAFAADDPAAEWTFEAARACWEPMWRPTQHIGVPGYDWQPMVLWDGSVMFGPTSYTRGAGPVSAEADATIGDNQLHLCVAFGEHMRFIDRTGRRNPLISRRLEQGRLPIPYVETRDGDLVWQEMVFAHLLGRSFEDWVKPELDDKLITHARFRVRNTGYARRVAHLWLYLEDLSKLNFVYASIVDEALGAALDHHYKAPFGFIHGKVRYVLATPAKGTIRWHDRIEKPEGVSGSASNVIEWEAALAPGEEAELLIKVPHGPVEKPVAEQIAALDSGLMYGDACRFWRSLDYGPGQIVTPDPLINDYLVAVAGQMASQVACRRLVKQWHYKTAPNINETYWPCNGAMAMPTLDLRGLPGLSERVLGTFVDTQTDDVGALPTERRGTDEGKIGGSGIVSGEGFAKIPGFLGNVGSWTSNTLLLSHGLELWALASHYRITRDDKWLSSGPGSPLEAMIKGFDWVITQRKRTMRKENGERVHHWGLLPAASAHDWLSGNAIFNDAYCIYGMIEVVRVLHEIKHPRAAEMAKELNEYRACLRDRCIEARDRARKIPLPDGTEIPYVPRDVYELDWAKIDWTYTGYGPLRAGAWGALDPEDELVSQTLAVLDAGFPKGEGPYTGIRPNTGDATNWGPISDRAAERHYLWRHYVEYETMWPVGYHLFLARDDLPRFFEWLFNNFAVTFHHDWLSGVEALDGTPSSAPGDAERWRAVRGMFVNERGGYDGSQQELFLLQAMPCSWLRPGNRMAVTDMGTYFGGKIDLKVQMAEDGNSVAVEAKLRQLAVKPKEIRVRLRSGDGRPLQSATVNGKSADVQPGDVILLPVQTEGIFRIIGNYR
jgi:hypothetical protein